MSANFILDCSLALAWCFDDEETPEAMAVQDRLETETALVPAHWFLEVTNVVLLAERKKRISTANAELFLSGLNRFDIEIDHEAPTRAFKQIAALCREFNLTSYDAAYLELAVRRQIPLGSLDEDLRTAATKNGIAVLGK